jgi:hypothetical protein
MIRVQQLKQPKVTSGKEVKPGKAVKVRGVIIKNTTKESVYVDTYDRKQ